MVKLGKLPESASPEDYKIAKEVYETLRVGKSTTVNYLNLNYFRNYLWSFRIPDKEKRSGQFKTFLTRKRSGNQIFIYCMSDQAKDVW